MLAPLSAEMEVTKARRLAGSLVGAPRSQFVRVGRLTGTVMMIWPWPVLVTAELGLVPPL